MAIRRPRRLSTRWLGVFVVLAAAARAAAGPPPAKEPAPDDDQRITKLIVALGDKEYAVRQRAEDELARIGFAAYEALVAAANHEDLEIAARARYLLRKIRGQWGSDEDPPEVKKLLADYESLQVEERARRIIRLAFLPDLKGTPAVCRVIRFERLTSLSEFAAIQIVFAEPFDSPSRARLRGLLRARLGGSTRPAAKWLLAYVRLHEDPTAGLPEWRRLVVAEHARSQRTPDKLNPEIAVAMLYAMALESLAQNDQAAADKALEQARRAPFPHDYLGLDLRLQTASMLARRGSMAWAETEYRALMDCNNPGVAYTAGRYLGEHLQATQRYLAAAEAYAKAVETSARVSFAVPEEAAKRVNWCRGQMNYCRACHWAEQKDPVKQLHYLELALQADPGDADALIACYRFPNPTPQFRERTLKQIQQATAAARTEMNDDAKKSLACNRLAWLVCNTEGNLDEALRASQTSLELSPGNDSYLDTLAHVYFARGDLPNAVKYQAMAVERNPHSILLSKELTRFRAALEEKSKKAPAGPGT